MPNLELAGLLYLVGFTLILVGMIILAVNIFLHKGEARKGEVGGVILIGPFPIIFGTSRRMMKIMLIIALALIAIILSTTFLPYLIRSV